MGFKIKHNRVHSIILLACGYSQVLGINYSKNDSSVVNDIMFCILVMIMILFGLLAKVINIKTASLSGKLEKQMCMDNKKSVGILKMVGYTGGNVNSSIYMNKSARSEAYTALYVDDNLMTGNL